MADAMKVGEALAEMGHSFDTDVLIARANQLVKLEGQALVEKSSSNLVLRKQVRREGERGGEEEGKRDGRMFCLQVFIKA